MSFYTSLNGLKNAQTDLGVIAHNIANVETNGFKKGRTEFADIVVGSAQTNPRCADNCVSDCHVNPTNRMNNRRDSAQTKSRRFAHG